MTPLTAANAIVRGWTHLYTWRLPATVRDTRRAEIESDLWEFAREVHDRRSLAAVIHVLARLVCGVPDDMAWRATQVTIGVAPLRAAIGVGAAIVVFGGMWVYTITRATELPAPAPLSRIVAVFPPPPPPPPPPPRFNRRVP